MAALARTEFSSALNAIAQESGLDPTLVIDTIKQAIVAAYKRDVRERGEDVEEKEFDATLDPETGEARVFLLEGDKREDVTPPGFGRIAVQTAKQVILQKIREAEKEAVLAQYEKRVGQLVSGTILRFDGPNVRIDIGRTEAIVPPQERIPNEKFNLNQRLTFLLKEIKETDKGREIILSRSDPEIVVKLFAREVPEISSGSVEIKAIAREAGNRTKVAVSSNQSGVDPVGSCVGQKGVRVQAVIGELNDEKIDVIPFSTTTEQFIASALSPADGATVKLDEKNKEARVFISEDQLSLAIGKEGQNVRLASKLSGWKIEIEGTPSEKKEEVVETEAKSADETAKPSEEGTSEKKEAVTEDATPGSASDDNKPATPEEEVTEAEQPVEEPTTDQPEPETPEEPKPEEVNSESAESDNNEK
ncbi:MAG: transcription termination factor NusA [Candidatus Blackburnbacteria bacterium RIFCSPHIGHO2_02_FULL_44_20]|uniref:Transcription termination/antitermination protein NusA n=1 Tax=Candidatus Blackburnbacteria bacterium RIFCSPHIGHO2_02_FULL_44_20 TaxID=1797516 RepID=A0A1G1V615_9BACT|nr:MAG: transcription termination factor NusA [Candidatus Blackburnbacteria bacterium RIFCSPHIGHO2_02_FULL_44_20]OGY10852.1 MAG: transcription termination factor NusA [Candidatus Blackburnbacteria bacterium RIFCSPHIGHO2_12_FULL_44_25]OGY14797.1 MAG: transcription termination factor NusA [Candidatus Blackburnbacteria bacterium RIFCSPLOWO2_01_FULL_44_43]